MNSIPTFSIIIPTRNRLNTFKMAINSVLNQDCLDFELIVADNSYPANNDVKFYLDKNCKKITNLVYIQTDGNLPMDVNWENASALARGEYILILPDRWIMLQGVLSILKLIIEAKKPECIFWGARQLTDLTADRKFEEAIYYEEVSSHQLLLNLLSFNGYKKDQVFTQNFPRGLNSAYKKNLIKEIRKKNGSFFQPVSCDYTSGISILINTKKMIEIFTPLYIPVGDKSNGARNSINGVPAIFRDFTIWRGLNLDSTFLTVLNDIENTLKQNGRADLIHSIDLSNALLSIISELHFKEWHGSSLDTLKMRKIIKDYIVDNKENFRSTLIYEIENLEKERRPHFLGLRRVLVAIGVFYLLYELKWRFINGFNSNKKRQENINLINYEIKELMVENDRKTVYSL